LHPHLFDAAKRSVDHKPALAPADFAGERSFPRRHLAPAQRKLRGAVDTAQETLPEALLQDVSGDRSRQDVNGRGTWVALHQSNPIRDGWEDF
jgi:hypothetical protein